ncbi:hypothetical protein OG698_39870 [Streptomyces sp. NBC_01003]|uniref:hypothetical protein n=1 Tax=Streptomyces sp. NBC_01003 TaxID=2903714 RepID=UPI00386E30D3|nr:hypothetical protein OG698_39870 [Streptomyces sp. NBC_01003]
MTPRAVPRTAKVAIGGNPLLRGGTHATVAEQVEAARRLASPVVAPAESGRRVGVTHGNGPQVGSIKRRADLAASLTPELPADLGASRGGTRRGPAGHHHRGGTRRRRPRHAHAAPP